MNKPFGPWSDGSTTFLIALRFLFGGALLFAAFGLWMGS